MTVMHEKLREIYNLFVERFLSEEQKISNQIFPET
jgi:hypothetical protein